MQLASKLASDQARGSQSTVPESDVFLRVTFVTEGMGKPPRPQRKTGFLPYSVTSVSPSCPLGRGLSSVAAARAVVERQPFGLKARTYSGTKHTRCRLCGLWRRGAFAVF